MSAPESFGSNFEKALATISRKDEFVGKIDKIAAAANVRTEIIVEWRDGKKPSSASLKNLLGSDLALEDKLSVADALLKDFKMGKDGFTVNAKKKVISTWLSEIALEDDKLPKYVREFSNALPQKNSPAEDRATKYRAGFTSGRLASGTNRTVNTTSSLGR